MEANPLDAIDHSQTHTHTMAHGPWLESLKKTRDAHALQGFSRGKTRFRGVSFRAHTGRWEARISGVEDNKVSPRRVTSDNPSAQGLILDATSHGGGRPRCGGWSKAWVASTSKD